MACLPISGFAASSARVRDPALIHVNRAPRHHRGSSGRAFEERVLQHYLASATPKRDPWRSNLVDQSPPVSLPHLDRGFLEKAGPGLAQAAAVGQAERDEIERLLGTLEMLVQAALAEGDEPSFALALERDREAAGVGRLDPDTPWDQAIAELRVAAKLAQKSFESCPSRFGQGDG
jgi:hypothetical protein